MIGGPDRCVQGSGSLLTGAGSGVVQQGGGNAVPLVAGDGVDALDAGNALPGGRRGMLSTQAIPCPAGETPYMAQGGGCQADVNEAAELVVVFGDEQNAITAAPFGGNEVLPVDVRAQPEEIGALFFAGQIVPEQQTQRRQVAASSRTNAWFVVVSAGVWQRQGALKKPETRREAQGLVAVLLGGVCGSDRDPQFGKRFGRQLSGKVIQQRLGSFGGIRFGEETLQADVTRSLHIIRMSLGASTGPASPYFANQADWRSIGINDPVAKQTDRRLITGFGE